MKIHKIINPRKFGILEIHKKINLYLKESRINLLITKKFI